MSYYPIVSLGEVADVNWGDTSKTKASYVAQGFLAYSATGADGYLPYADYDRDAVVLSAIGARCGRTWFAAGKWSCIKNTIRLWSTSPLLDNRYLYWATANPDVWPRRGAAQPFIAIGDARQVRIPLPPLSEQKRIAEILDAADALRAKRSAALFKLDMLAQSVFAEMCSKELHSANRAPLESFLEEFRYGTSIKSAPEGYPTLRIPNVVGGDVDASELKFVPLADSEFRRLKLRDGDLLFVRTNGNPDYVGRCAVFTHAQANLAGHQSSDWAYASYLIRARVKTDEMNPWFLKAFLHHPEGKKALRERSKTSAGQFNINTESLGSIPIPVVALQRQEAFAEASSRIAPTYLHYQKSKKHFDTLFASLQHRAFRGELTLADTKEVAA